ncbi:VanZ family protein [Bifidobacterium sp. 82T24]|uniref:VanZ family protein n=1 Tax=Bifidobacterium pluvialisilvae TaxID=2834436 RepID=UPI001C5657F3|nr:VanZ family protein [Bifidobacterium pluvialisilvae]MBW3088664.1 VanZ family protein [Bifidobacterium pluvialisilvae]
MGYIAYFSRPFMLAVVLWPFVSAVLTVPVLALLYHGYNRIRFSQALVAYSTVLYAIGLLCFTLYPMPEDAAAYCAAHHLTPQLNPLQFIGDIRTDGLSAIMQIALNVVFFLPLGFIMGRVFRWPIAVALPVGFATSLMIETLQLTGFLGFYPCSYRLFDVDDLMTNTLGAMLGYAAAGLFDRLVPPRSHDLTTVTRPGFLRRCITYIIDLTVVIAAAMPVTALATIIYDITVVHDITTWHAIPPVGHVFGNEVAFSDVVMLVSLLIFELLMPWLRGGSTLGGWFTHMTCETRPRSGWRRVLFYAARTAVFVIVVFALLIPQSVTFILALLVFYCVKKQMPYDLLPADDAPLDRVGITE